MVINAFITIGGHGTRLQSIKKGDKQNLYYLDKTIIEHTKEIIPKAKTVGHTKTSSRLETLNQIPVYNNVLIIDCDIIPFGIDLSMIDESCDYIFVFESIKNKYGSIIINNQKVIKVSENENISKYKSSGVYFCSNLKSTMRKMTNPNSIASGMIGAKVIMENTFKRFGDIPDYYESLGICLQ
jgi:hypothetical protein